MLNGHYIDVCLEILKKKDPEIFEAVNSELERQKSSIELIASENIVSEDILASMGSVLTNKYAEGYPGSRYYGGCKFVDISEQLAIDRAKKLFGAESANVQPHSGAQANMSVYFSVLSPGDTVMGMNLPDGGHLTHGSKVNFSGQWYNFVSYGVDIDTGFINYDKVYELAKEHKPKLIVCGASAYPRTIDFSKFREIADSVGSLLMADIAHIAGLIVAGVHPSPVPYADFVTSTTHKTLRGPRGGLILCKKKFEEKINRAVFPGIQGGPLEHTIAAKAVCFKNAVTDEFKDYIKKVVSNCKSMAEEFKSLGMKLISGGTDNHLLLIDLSEFGITGHYLETILDEVNITLNKDTIPGDKLNAREASGVRIGTAAVTTRGMNEDDCKKIANLIFLACKDFQKNKSFIKSEVSSLVSKYPIYQ